MIEYVLGDGHRESASDFLYIRVSGWTDYMLSAKLGGQVKRNHGRTTTVGGGRQDKRLFRKKSGC